MGAYDVGADRFWGHLEDRRVTGDVTWRSLYAASTHAFFSS
jgi:hypothetical protein